jgi:hypothetical protein
VFIFFAFTVHSIANGLHEIERTICGASLKNDIDARAPVFIEKMPVTTSHGDSNAWFCAATVVCGVFQTVNAASNVKDKEIILRVAK